MSSTQVGSDGATGTSRPAGVPTRLEVVVVPVSDVDRAKSFYEGLGWRVDVDAGDDEYRAVHMTPTGSATSIIFGKGITSAEPGSIDSFLLAVEDIDAAIDELRSRGADVTDAFHDPAGGLGGGWRPGTEGRAPGHDPQRRSYASYASFFDPDGNKWLLQELTERLPGRVDATDIGALAQLLHETAERHDPYEQSSPPHDWWDWYAAYIDARQSGSTSEAASEAAGRYMTDVKHIGSPT